MARLVSLDKKTEISTSNPTEIVQLKAQGFRVLEEAPAQKPAEAQKSSAASKNTK